MGAERVEFEAVIGVDVKGETWSCVEIPDSVAFFGSGKSARVDVTIDEVALENVGTLPTGAGGHMVSLDAKVRKVLGKERRRPRLRDDHQAVAAALAGLVASRAPA